MSLTVKISSPRRCFPQPLHFRRIYWGHGSIVYFDLDGFKAVNDRFGHRRGDKLLCAVVDRTMKNPRKTDLMARLGGGEFRLLLPEIDQDGARSMLLKIQSALLREMRRHNWRAAFSIGVLSYRESSATVNKLIKQADDLMYSVKNDGKNAIACSVYQS